MKIAKWGNSLAVRIPADVVRALNLKEGDEVDLLLRDADGRLEVARRDRLIHSLREYRGLLPAGSFDRDAAHAR